MAAGFPAMQTAEYLLKIRRRLRSANSVSAPILERDRFGAVRALHVGRVLRIVERIERSADFVIEEPPASL